MSRMIEGRRLISAGIVREYLVEGSSAYSRLIAMLESKYTEYKILAICRFEPGEIIVGVECMIVTVLTPYNATPLIDTLG